MDMKGECKVATFDISHHRGKNFLSVQEVMKDLVCGKDTVYRLIDTGELVSWRNGSQGRHRITMRSYVNYLSSFFKIIGG